MTAIKNKWSMPDYASMGWHDCRMYSVSFLDEGSIVSFDIDYIFDYKIDKQKDVLYLVAPAALYFFDAFDLIIEINSGNLVGATIENLNISYLRKSKNGAVDIFLCVIELDIGKLSVKTSGFEMILKKAPVLSPTQDLGRPV
ncbi:hypothetical protein [Mesorhizobium sp. M0199]|uniref:hypothetical protein n=1 Tax=Mesorhizobium sp. M0199 TaxID=2956911 RepID=UPI003335A821